LSESLIAPKTAMPKTSTTRSVLRGWYSYRVIALILASPRSVPLR
jgi:hypothetical protein